MAGVRITSCICVQIPFNELLPLARSRRWTLPQLVRETGCGDQCGLCRPYLRIMLATGQTVFHELLPEEPASTGNLSE